MRAKITNGGALLLVTSILLLIAGCGPLAPVGRTYNNFTAYYNTYYNAKKYFKQAERQYRLNRLQHNDPTTDPPVPIDAYQRVIEAGANLLEFYQNCRWIDDSLILMGISYYRLSEFGRAEKKFSELITIFPRSEHRAQAGIWRARAMIAQGRYDDAEKALLALLPGLKKQRDLAAAHFTLANIFFDAKNWRSAAEHYQQSALNLTDREERIRAYFQLGISELEQEQYAEAQAAFFRVITRSRSQQQVFDASIYWSRCAVQMGDYEGAERILYDLKRDPSFAALESAIDIEIAGLAVVTGQVDEGIGLYEAYLENSERGPERGLAYFRLGEIYRDRKLDLSLARASFDSVATAGAERALADSAVAESEKLAQGIIAIERLQFLNDSLELIQSQVDSLRAIDLADVSELPVSPTAPADSSDESEATALNAVPDSSLVDSLDALAETDSVTQKIVEQMSTPATRLADSLIQALVQQQRTANETPADSLTVSDSTEIVVAETAAEDTLTPLQRRHLAGISLLDSTLNALHVDLMSTYLHIGEFFRQTVDEPDSALYYLELATAQSVQHPNYWKALLQLADMLARQPEPESERIENLYRRALEYPSLPFAVRNDLRDKLGLPSIDRELNGQDLAFERAESAFMSDVVSADSLVKMYASVVKIDSFSNTALKAFWGMLYLYEHRLDDSDGARRLANTLITMYPDSAFVPVLQGKMTEIAAESSVFALSDEELTEARELSRKSISEEVEAEGWLPPEEELLGRRYR